VESWKIGENFWQMKATFGSAPETRKHPSQGPTVFLAIIGNYHFTGIFESELAPLACHFYLANSAKLSENTKTLRILEFRLQASAR
jgi:hypothetical protein